MTPMKEPSYFSRDLAADRLGNFLRYDVDRHRYLALFKAAGRAKRIGEASTRYLFSRDAPMLIAREQPNARVIAILRNPIDMIASLHAHKVAAGTEDLPELVDALGAEADRRAGRRIPENSNPLLSTYRERARFGEQLPRWFQTFGGDRVHVILFEEMIRDPASQFRRLLEFLDIRADYQPATFAAHNPAHKARGGVVRVLAKSAPVQSFVWRLMPAVLGDSRTREMARRVGRSRLRRRIVKRPDVPDSLRRRLEAEFAPDVDRLSELLGHDVASVWFGTGSSNASTLQ